MGIRQSIRRGLGQARQIRLPVYVQELVQKVKKETTAFIVENSRSPTPEEMAERLGISLLKYAEIANYLQDPVSLDASVGAAQFTLLDSIQTCTQNSPDDSDETLREEVECLLQLLPPRHAFVIRKRFGLDAEPPLSKTDVAELLGVSLPRVTEIERSALAKLRFATSQGRMREALLERVQDAEEAYGI